MRTVEPTERDVDVRVGALTDELLVVVAFLPDTPCVRVAVVEAVREVVVRDADGCTVARTLELP